MDVKVHSLLAKMPEVLHQFSESRADSDYSKAFGLKIWMHIWFW
jgi:hypothetical protein